MLHNSLDKSQQLGSQVVANVYIHLPAFRMDQIFRSKARIDSATCFWTGLDWADRCWLPSMLSNLEFSCPQLSSYMRTHHSFFFLTFQECYDGSPVFRLCWVSIFVKVDDIWHQCQWNVVFFIRFMASVMPDAQTYLLTGARINLTLPHLCSCFSGYPLRGEKSGSLGPETVAGFLYFWFLKGEGNRLWHAPVTAVLVPLVRFPSRPGRFCEHETHWESDRLGARSDCICRVVLWQLLPFIQPCFHYLCLFFLPDPVSTPHLSDTQKVRMQVSGM